MDFSKLENFLDSVDRKLIPSTDIAIYIDHKPVFRHMTGFSDAKFTKPTNGDELYFLYSATKVFTGALGAIMLEKGKFSLEDKVSKYLPEYEELYIKQDDTLKKATNPLLIKHLFTMCGGYDYNIGSNEIVEMREKTNNKATTREMVSAISKMPLIFEPGTKYKYSLCLDVLAGVIEVVSGMKYGEAMKKYIFEPLGIKNMTFTPTKEHLAKMSQQYTFNHNKQQLEKVANTCCYRLTENFESGGAGLVGGVSDYILLADALACGGVGKSGNRIMNEQTVELIRKNQLDTALYESFHENVKAAGIGGYGYGLGVRTKIKNAEDNLYSSIGEFGWDGAAGAYIVIDPKYKLSIFYAQHVLQGRLDIHPDIRDITYEILNVKNN